MTTNNNQRRGFGHVTSGNGSLTHGATESDPLLPKAKEESSATRLRKHLTSNVDRRWGDLVLLVCCLITGLLDSSSTFIWGCFVSMQTGNTVYVGLGVVDPYASTRWIKSGTSIAFFCFGSFCFSLFHRTFGPRKRWVLAVSFTFQLLCVIAAAIIASQGKPKADELDWRVLLPLMLLGFQSSGQAVSSRALQYNALTSVVLTSIYCDLFADPKILAPPTQNPERNRRLGAPIMLLIGACLGGVFTHTEIGMTGALAAAALLKICIVIAWLFWRVEPQQHTASA